jgi:hypothetical protein
MDKEAPGPDEGGTLGNRFEHEALGGFANLYFGAGL